MKDISEMRAELEEVAASHPIAVHLEIDPVVRACIASAIRALEAADLAGRVRIDPNG